MQQFSVNFHLLNAFAVDEGTEMSVGANKRFNNFNEISPQVLRQTLKSFSKVQLRTFNWNGMILRFDCFANEFMSGRGVVGGL